MKIGTTISFFVQSKNKYSGFNLPPSGGSARYYKIRKGIGLKLYYLKNERNIAYRNQALFYNHGLAPKLGNKINLPEEFGVYRFGLITQHANIVEELSEEQCLSIERKILSSKLTYHPIEIKPRNVGEIKGNLVLVDFDSASNAGTLHHL